MRESRLLIPSGPGGEFTQPRAHLLASRSLYVMSTFGRAGIGLGNRWAPLPSPTYTYKDLSLRYTKPKPANVNPKVDGGAVVITRRLELAPIVTHIFYARARLLF